MNLIDFINSDPDSLEFQNLKKQEVSNPKFPEWAFMEFIKFFMEPKAIVHEKFLQIRILELKAEKEFQLMAETEKELLMLDQKFKISNIQYFIDKDDIAGAFYKIFCHESFFQSHTFKQKFVEGATITYALIKNQFKKEDIDWTGVTVFEYSPANHTLVSFFAHYHFEVYSSQGFWLTPTKQVIVDEETMDGILYDYQFASTQVSA